MEKMAPAEEAKFPLTSGIPFFEALQVVFEPITLRRPLRLFGTATGLSVGATAPPDPDFLVHLIYGAGHQRLLRMATQEEFKNFENMVRGKNRTTERTKRALLDKLGLDEATLGILMHGRPDGPLLPAYLELFAALEGMFLRMFGSATIGRAKCKCCGGDLLADADTWWEAQQLQFEPGAYRFVDRLLKAALGGVLLMSILGQRHSIDLMCLHNLVAPNIHPIGHWIEMARSVRGVSHDWELTVFRDRDGHSYGPASDGRMRKWRSGQDLLPMSLALAMIEGTADLVRLKHALLAARTLALAVDVIQATAAHTNALGRRPAQEVIAARLKYLEQHLRIGLGTLLSSNPRQES
jgi:hypothetical protein